MSWLILLQIALSLLSSIGTAADKQGLAELADIINAAIAKLNEVHSTPVTKEQLESLRG
jgi:hypothetical protein